jgi:hypothetical protein
MNSDGTYFGTDLELTTTYPHVSGMNVACVEIYCYGTITGEFGKLETGGKTVGKWKVVVTGSDGTTDGIHVQYPGVVGSLTQWQFSGMTTDLGTSVTGIYIVFVGMIDVGTPGGKTKTDVEIVNVDGKSLVGIATIDDGISFDGNGTFTSV